MERGNHSLIGVTVTYLGDLLRGLTNLPLPACHEALVLLGAEALCPHVLDVLRQPAVCQAVDAAHAPPASKRQGQGQYKVQSHRGCRALIGESVFYIYIYIYILYTYFVVVRKYAYFNE